MSKKAIIITVPNPLGNIARIPYVVKSLKLVEKFKNLKGFQRIKIYVDNEGYTWVYMKDDSGEVISFTKGDGEIIILE